MAASTTDDNRCYCNVPNACCLCSTQDAPWAISLLQRATGSAVHASTAGRDGAGIFAARSACELGGVEQLRDWDCTVDEIIRDMSTEREFRVSFD